MNIWKILGIEKTKDKDAIKKAYRTKLVSVNPEDDPEGFMELRNAFEEANRYAEEAEEPEEMQPETPVALFQAALKDLYQDFYRRISEEEWRKLLDLDAMVSLETSAEATFELLRFLMGNFNLPGSIIRLIIDVCGLDDRKNELFEQFPRDYIAYLFQYEQLDDAIDFQRFEGAPDADYDEYIETYYKLERAGRNSDISEQEALLQKLEESGIEHPCYYLGKIRFLMQKEELSEAMKVSEYLTQAYPDFLSGFIFQGDIYANQKRYEEARVCYEKALELKPDSYVARGRFVVLDCAEGNFEKARDMCMELLQENHYDNNIRTFLVTANEGLIEQNLKRLAESPEDRKLRMEISWSYFQSYRFDEAIEFLWDMEPAEEEACEYYNLLGRSYFAKREYRKALSCFMKWCEAIARIPEDDHSEEAEKMRSRLPYATSLIGNCYLKLGDLEAAKTQIDNALQVEHEEIMLALEAKCELEYRLKNYTDCLAVCDELEKREIRNYLAQDYRAKCYFDMEMYQEAVSVCEYMMAVYPFIDPYEIMIKIFLKIEDYESAEKVIKSYEALGGESDVCNMYKAKIVIRKSEDYGKALNLLEVIEPHLTDGDTDIVEQDEFYLLLGECYEKQNDRKKAVLAYEKAVKINDKSPVAHGILGLAYRRLNMQEEALRELTRQLELAPSGYYYMSRGVLYKYRRELKLAEQDFRSAMERDPENSVPLEFLAKTLLIMNREKEAVSYMERAIACSAERDEVYRLKLNLADIYKKMQDYDKAEVVYLEMLEEYDLQYDVIEEYSHLLEKQGKISEALKQAKHLYDYFPDRRTDACVRRLQILCTAGKVEEALELYNRMSKEQTLTCNACFAVSCIYLENGQYHQAEEALLLACTLDKENRHCYFSNLAEAASHQFGGRGRVKRYIQAMKDRVQLRTPEDFLEYARTARIEKKYTLAEKYIREALAIEMCEGCMMPCCADAYLEMGKVLEQKGKKGEALIAYEKALKAGGYDFWLLKRIKRLKNDSRN